MSIRKVSLVEGEYYHIYNRGNSKQVIFKDKTDYVRFMYLLYVLNTEERFNFFDHKKGSAYFNPLDTEKESPLIAIGAYCLMPNHFHLLITPLTENGASRFMQKLSTAYSMYFNKKYSRSGSLFQGKFKAEHADEDRYLKYLFSYIHLNPVKLIDKNWKEDGIKNKQKVFEYLATYPYNSFLDYAGVKREEAIILDKKKFPTYFTSLRDFKNEILSWFTYNAPTS